MGVEREGAGRPPHRAQGAGALGVRAARARPSRGWAWSAVTASSSRSAWRRRDGRRPPRDQPRPGRVPGCRGTRTAPVGSSETSQRSPVRGSGTLALDAVVAALGSGHVDGVDEHGGSPSDKVPALQWIAAGVDLGGRRHILLDGEWFALCDEYLRHVDLVVRRAFDRRRHGPRPVGRRHPQCRRQGPRGCLRPPRRVA
ncbi:DUF6119 family protein [Actinosynnema sp. NPDC050436]|uniref:DUF6119 family protein n=1 Tax=Actinosynnema sp. NPDC050436 TaxID=3155659 RepID=UPI0033CE7937